MFDCYLLKYLETSHFIRHLPEYLIFLNILLLSFYHIKRKTRLLNISAVTTTLLYRHTFQFQSGGSDIASYVQLLFCVFMIFMDNAILLALQ